ncbi:BQ2448_6676 [Microbotryum intermedium]|uniref:BQ2448_6676 protein n=1 Tax=Microbotryum intermedium TaxID=269621 RepID=A0A238FQT4_9BASI|nr:BQ2448_6676 [Microbotryum intermedium]
MRFSVLAAFSLVSAALAQCITQLGLLWGARRGAGEKAPSFNNRQRASHATNASHDAAIVNPLTINTPTSLIECQPYAVTWSGGVSPYFISVLPGGQLSAPALATLGDQPTTATSYTWTVNIAAGTSITLKVLDSAGNPAYAAMVTIQPGSSTSCLSASTTTGAAGSASASASGPVVSGATSGAVSSSAAVSSAAATSTSAAAAATTSAAAAATTTRAASTATTASAAAAATSSRAASGASLVGFSSTLLGVVGAAFLAIGA